MSNEIRNTAIAFAEGYLRARGCKVIEKNWTCEHGTLEFVFEDGGELVFATISARRHDGKKDRFPKERSSRMQLRAWVESMAISYLVQTGHDHGSTRLRFDEIGVLLTDDGAIIRHHVNALSRVCDDAMSA